MSFAGFDVTTGTELWRFEGDHWVWAAGDGYALVGGPLGGGGTGGGATLLDVRTGNPVEGQTWPQGTFHAGCCGEPSFTVADGGALLTSDGHRLSLFVPAAIAAPTVDASI